MKDQIIEVSDRFPFFPQLAQPTVTAATPSYPDGAFWMQVYQPLSDWRNPLPNSRILCPWAMAAELEDELTNPDRRRNLMEALKRGLRIIRQYGLPAARITFAEDRATRAITVWVD
ncbi:MAG: hypothetical protein ACHQHN_05185 [Sphingobacteriales bacterium]